MFDILLLLCAEEADRESPQQQTEGQLLLLMVMGWSGGVLAVSVLFAAAVVLGTITLGLAAAGLCDHTSAHSLTQNRHVTDGVVARFNWARWGVQIGQLPAAGHKAAPQHL